MKNFKLFLGLLTAVLTSRLALADLVGPYTPDANTLFLLHFDEAAGGSVTANAGSKGGSFYSCDLSAASATPPTVTTMLGAAGYVNGATDFHNCAVNPTTGYLFGYDANNSGAYQGEGSAPAADALAMTNLNIGNGGQSPFTIEALIQPNTISGNQEIICTDSSGSSRAFQFRISAGALQFSFITGGQAITVPIPTTGPQAFVAGNWYHVAVTYDGAIATLYWTKLDPANGAANALGTQSLTLGTASGAVVGPLCIGNENRAAAGEQFMGSIDEVRISNIARSSGQMQFFSPLVTITANPISQNVDYNQSVTFNVGASSQFPLGYQWRFNSNSIAGATNSSYTIANVAAGDSGDYDCVVTNTSAYAATSSSAQLVVGAANFLANRYSFTTDATDSVGGQDGTLFGDALVSGGQLVLDGTSGTYMELPPNLFNGANATALTIEFWATFGVNSGFARVFDFGYTNVTGGNVVGANYVAFTPNNGSGSHQILIDSASDPAFQQVTTAAGALDGLTRHIACVIDSPNKTMSIYTNGVLESVNTNMTIGINSLNDAFSYVGRSLFPNDPYLNGSIDELRIFKGALSGITIKQSDDQGPDTLLADGPAKFVTLPTDNSVPAGQVATFTAAAIGYLPINYQWFKNGALVPDATNASYSFVTTLDDNNATVQCYATNVIGVTTYVTNTPAATLSVFVPPTLAWLDFANGGASGDWDTFSLNWTNAAGGGGVIAYAPTNGVLFDSRGSGSPMVNLAQPTTPYKMTVDAAADYTITSYALNGWLAGQGYLTKLNSGRLTIDVTNSMSGPTTISGGTLQIGNYDSYGTLGSGPVTNNATLSFNRADTALVVPNAIHGSGTVSYDGYGSVTVSGASDYSGNTLLNAGVLNLQSSAGLGATSGGTTVASGGQLYITANVDVGAETLTLNGVGPDGSGALRKGGAGVTTWNGPVNLASDSGIGLDGGATLTLSNTVSGSGVLNVSGSGTLALSAANNYSAGTVVAGGIVNVNANGALGTGLATITGTAHFTLGDGVNITNAFIANTVSPGANTGLLMVNDNTNGIITTLSGPLEFDSSPANGGNFIGPISSGYLNVTGPITNAVTGVISSRNGFVRFSGGGSYTGFVLNQGMTSIGADNGLCPDAALTVGASGDSTFDLNGFNQTLTGLTDGATYQELVTNSAANLSTLTLNLAASGTYSGVIGGKVALVQNGAGILLLAGTNTYTGNTTVNGGTLELAQPALAKNSTVTVANGAFLQLDFAVTNQVAGLVLNGVSQPLGVYNNVTSPSFITGSGSLEVAVAVATNPTNLTATVSGGNLILSWPADHTGWHLQVQTNSLASGLGTNWVDVPNTDSVNAVTNAVNAANGSVFYRMVYP
jgi:autotransporter-associated beta strand protein